MINKEKLEQLNNKVYLSPKECAEIVGVFPTTVIYWLKEKGLRHYKTPGGHYKIKKDDLIDFVESKNIKKVFKNKNKIKVLLIEDDSLLANSIKEGLKDNYEVEVVTSYQDSLKKISPKYNLILADISLKDGNGLELTEIVKNNPETAKIPVVIISGVSKPETIERGLYLALDFIKKPFSIKELEIRLSKLLKNLIYG